MHPTNLAARLPREIIIRVGSGVFLPPDKLDLLPGPAARNSPRSRHGDWDRVVEADLNDPVVRGAFQDWSASSSLFRLFFA